MKKPASAAAVLILAGLAAFASVKIDVYESGADVIARATGLLDLPAPLGSAYCGGSPGVIPNGAIAPASGSICLGSGQGFTYPITGPTGFGVGPGRYADESTGNLFGFNASLGILATPTSVVDSQSIWRNTTLAQLGLQSGDLGTWYVGDQAITARASVPGPFGFLGVLAFWEWSRRLRHRIRSTR